MRLDQGVGSHVFKDKALPYLQGSGKGVGPKDVTGKAGGAGKRVAPCLLLRVPGTEGDKLWPILVLEDLGHMVDRGVQHRDLPACRSDDIEDRGNDVAAGPDNGATGLHEHPQAVPLPQQPDRSFEVREIPDPVKEVSTTEVEPFHVFEHMPHAVGDLPDREPQVLEVFSFTVGVHVDPIDRRQEVGSFSGVQEKLGDVHAQARARGAGIVSRVLGHGDLRVDAYTHMDLSPQGRRQSLPVIDRIEGDIVAQLGQLRYLAVAQARGHVVDRAGIIQELGGHLGLEQRTGGKPLDNTEHLFENCQVAQGF